MVNFIFGAVFGGMFVALAFCIVAVGDDDNDDY